LQRLLTRQAFLPILLLAGIVAFRGQWFFTPFSEPSNALYVRIGQSWLDGHLPYTATWDYRPPGYFALYAAAIALAGDAHARDLLAVVSLAATALALGLLAVKLDPQGAPATGWWAAAFFVLLSPVNDATYGQAEVQIGAFIAWALVCVWPERPGWRAAALAGLLAGCALQCKLSALPIALVPLAVLAWPPPARGGALAGRAAPRGFAFAAFAAGFLVPVVADVAVYAFADQLRALWEANVGATIRRAQVRSLWSGFSLHRAVVFRQPRVLAPQLELALFALRPAANRSLIATAGWLAAALLSIVAANEYPAWHFVLLTAPVALLGALGFVALGRALAGRVPARILGALAVLTVLLTFALQDYYETVMGVRYFDHRVIGRDAAWRPDEFDTLLATIRRVAPGDRSVVEFELSPYLYNALDIPAPTVFAYTDVLFDPRLSAMPPIDGPAELARILAARPHIVAAGNFAHNVRYDPSRIALVNAIFARNYTPVAHGSDFTIYRLTSLR